MPLSLSQVAIRSTGIGASEIGAICGYSFWKRAADGSPAGGPHSVYLAKRRLVEPSPRTIASETGDDAEWLAERRYERETGIKLAPLLDDNGEPLTMRHQDHPWVLASIDRVRTTDLIPVEVKFMAGLRAHWHEGRNPDQCSDCGRPQELHWRKESRGVPDDVFCQVQWQLFVCGAPYAHVARFWVDPWDGLQFKIYEVTRSEKIIEMLFQKGHEFWHNHVLPGIPPDPDPSDDSELCERLFAQKMLRKMQKAPLGTERYAREFLEARRLKKEAETKEASAANWLRRIVGDAAGLEGDGFVVTNKSRVDGVRVLKVREKE